MATLPLEILLGLYLGLLTGIVPAFAAGSLGFLVRYFTGVGLPGFGVVVMALSIASVQGGLLGLVEPDIAQSPRLLVAVLVVLMLALYAHNQGDKLGAELPRHLSLTALRQRTLSADVVEFVGSVGQVTVRPTGEIHDLEGYPPLSPALRSTLKTGSWRFPADLPLSELSVRLEERLRTDHDLADVEVSIDERGQATIAAAPPSSGLSKRIPDGHRAVSLTTLVPTGTARGDEVVVDADGELVRGTVCSVRTEVDESLSADDATEAPATVDANDANSSDDEPVSPPTANAPRLATAGGTGRITVSLPRRRARTVLGAESIRLTVCARATEDAFEAFSRLREAGYAIRRAALRTADAARRLESEGSDLVCLARRRPDAGDAGTARNWQFGADVEGPLEAGDEVYVAGREPDVEAFLEPDTRATVTEGVR
ncbi:potassium transporter TrkA [Natronosalvus rutilus]|uniref:Potassium transporter TrkA n=1 Tax=Natronosalvus rutilus TaxID=2953753 RepID=A0A9E7N7L0_9EURY|nr:potassium transporter TrkA [Natronosalvus rutilus]UTF53189.1 potassium transporter TrkA [Natronosalvus rutilus]